GENRGGGSTLPANCRSSRRRRFLRQPSSNQKGERGERRNQVVLLARREGEEQQYGERPNPEQEMGLTATIAFAEAFAQLAPQLRNRLNHECAEGQQPHKDQRPERPHRR